MYHLRDERDVLPDVSIRPAVNAEIADWLVRLTTASRFWGFGLCFLHLCNVKRFP